MNMPESNRQNLFISTIESMEQIKEYEFSKREMSSKSEERSNYALNESLDIGKITM
jgi:hypothetical protein